MRILLAVDGGYLQTTITDIPLRGKLTHLLVGEVILKEDHAATNEVALLVLGYSIGHIVLNLSSLLNVGIVALGFLTVEHIVHRVVSFAANFVVHFIGDSTLGGIQGTVLQALQEEGIPYACDTILFIMRLRLVDK